MIFCTSGCATAPFIVGCGMCELRWGWLQNSVSGLEDCDRLMTMRLGEQW